MLCWVPLNTRVYFFLPSWKMLLFQRILTFKKAEEWKSLICVKLMSRMLPRSVRCPWPKREEREWRKFFARNRKKRSAQNTPGGATGRRTNAAAGFFVLYRYRGRESQRSPEGGWGDSSPRLRGRNGQMFRSELSNKVEIVHYDKLPFGALKSKHLTSCEYSPQYPV